MKIRREQMMAMLADNPTIFRDAVKKLVREDHGFVVDGLPEPLFDEMIDSGTGTARSYGLKAPDALAAFILLMFEFGPEFHRHPAIHKVLTDTTRAPDDRLTAVVDTTPSEVWEHIQSLLHRQTWFPELRESTGG